MNKVYEQIALRCRTIFQILTYANKNSNCKKRQTNDRTADLQTGLSILDKHYIFKIYNTKFRCGGLRGVNDGKKI